MLDDKKATIGISPGNVKMKKKVDLKSFVLGTLIGAIIVVSVTATTKRNQAESWQYQTTPQEVLKKKLKERIIQAVEERWTLAANHDSSIETHLNPSFFPTIKTI
ncbi:MAG: hypothetical protein HN445_08450 [Bacteroidetes Order II. Incertae sedis bacterium]|jgi:hypothetical protein|nr:hypothetical protein [Bacteroidetes Order II. bacterium]